MKRFSHALALALLASGIRSLVVAAPIQTYRIDPINSSVQFSIRHFFTRVPGSFTRFSGTIKVDRDDLTNSSVHARIEAASIDTRVSMRDNDLRSAHFFDVAKFPAITFQSTSWTKTGDNTFDVAGNLTMHGVKKAVVLKVKCLGFGTGAGGVKICGWKATTTLDRNFFGLKRYPEMLGADVRVTINVEADLQN